MCAAAEMGGPKCNVAVLEQLKKMAEQAFTESNTVWKGLDQFKHLN
jgi:hypothetical protein